jgi:hypothetical protein
MDTPHSVVLAGIQEGQAFLFDPAIDDAPVVVAVDELLLAWSTFDFTYAVLRIP